MTDERRPAPGTGGLSAALTRKVAAARRTIWVERIAGAFWPLWCVLLLGAALAILDVFAALPGRWGMALSVVLALGALAAAGRGFRVLRGPTRADAMRRLDDSIGSRAVTMLDEEIAVGRGDGDAERLWRAHRARVAAQAATARAPDADLRLAPVDPWNLRFASLAVLLAALGFAQVGGADRIAGLLNPAPPAARAATLVPALEAWAAPPPYTGAAPVYLTEKDGADVTVPTGSIVTLRASGIAGAPTLTGLDAEAGFTEEAEGIYGFSRALTGDARIAVLFGDREQAGWSFTVTPDLPPEVEIAEAPAPTAERALGFSYLGRDDYGIASARAVIIADRSAMADPPEEIDPPVDLDLNVFTGYADAPEPVAFEEDFTRHPLAGSPVRMVVTVEDAAGQTGETAAIRFTLPARVFTEPMAKALIEQRRALAWDIRQAWDVLDLLEAVTAFPDDYFDDAKAQLATSSAIRRLTYALEQDRVADERADILELLWQAALRLEEGDLSDELEQLRAAQRRLKDALERGASDEEIERLMDEMRQAMRDYLNEMARQAQRDMENGQEPQQGQQGQQQTLSREDLERMLEEMEQAARNGAREQAEQMLSMLGQMLENLRMAQQQPGQGGEGGEQGQQEQALQDMMRRQQDLADETFRQLQEGMDGRQQNRPGQGEDGRQQPGQGQGPGRQPQGQPGQQGQGQQGQGRQPGQGQQGRGGEDGRGQGRRPGEGGQPGGRGGDRRSAQGLSGEQGGLRDELGSLIPAIPGEGDARDALGQAEREMEAARNRLSEGDLNSALDDQARALDRLREGAQALAEQNRREAEQGQGQQTGEGTAETGSNPDELDPFGRVGRTFGPDDGRGVEVPGERARNRAQEIQREIRRRQGERTRPQEERDYLDRLQDRF